VRVENVGKVLGYGEQMLGIGKYILYQIHHLIIKRTLFTMKNIKQLAYIKIEFPLS
jgi:hypothetical protein